MELASHFAVYFSSLLATLNRRDEISTQLKGDDEVAILPVSGTVRNGHGQSRGGVQPRCEQHRPEVSQVSLALYPGAISLVTRSVLEPGICT